MTTAAEQEFRRHMQEAARMWNQGLRLDWQGFDWLAYDREREAAWESAYRMGVIGPSKAGPLWVAMCDAQEDP